MSVSKIIFGVACCFDEVLHEPIKASVAMSRSGAILLELMVFIVGDVSV
jgi:hypothetical protein